MGGMQERALRNGVRWNADEAFAYCEAVTRAHEENFPVASRLVPRRIRPHICAIYAFARLADDMADEGGDPASRLRELDRWEARLDECLEGSADHPVFVALGETVRKFELPDRLLRDLLDAFRQDCRVSRYARWEDLLDYCRRSANPVGRLVLLLFGRGDEAQARHADAICTSLQLTNFWQDLAIDVRKDRIYLPAEDRSRFGVTEDDLRAGRLHDGLRGLLEEVVSRTRRRFEDGRPLLREVGGRFGLELRMVWLGGRRILDRIEAGGFDVFRRRPRLTTRDRIGIAGRAVLGRWAVG